MASLASKIISMPKFKSKGIHRKTWPRVRETVIRGTKFIVVDARPHGPREYFQPKDLETAKARAHELDLARNRYGTAAVLMTLRDRADFEYGKERLEPHGANMRDAVEHYMGHLERVKQLEGGKPMPEALDEWEATYMSKNRSPETLKEIRVRVAGFKRAFGEMKVAEITPANIQDYINGYQADGKSVSERTKLNIRVKLAQFFNLARLRGWRTDNPCEMVQVEAGGREIIILSVTETVDLLQAAKASPHHSQVVPYVATCLFAGLRPGEAEHLDWKDLHFDIKEIDVRPETSKTRKLRHVRMEPALIEWLMPYRKRNGKIIGEAFRDKWEAVRRAAGYRVGSAPEGGWPKTARRWPEDVMRHSFASYWLPIYHSKAELAMQMGNSQDVIDRHYRRTIREADAKAFWSLRPEGATVVGFEKTA